MNKYGMTQIPDGIVPRTEENKSDVSILKWSGDFPIPAIGQKVKINFNDLGTGVVDGYFQEGGYFGVRVKLDKEPAWKVKQHKGTQFAGMAMIFGVEIKEKR